MHIFCMFGTDLYAQSVLINKISALELSRKLIKSALLVGYDSPMTMRNFTLSLSHAFETLTHTQTRNSNWCAEQKKKKKKTLKFIS